MQELFDPARHEPLDAPPWTDAAAQQAIARICASADAEFDEHEGGWLLHPQDEPTQAGQRSFNLYYGAAGVMLALRHLASQGAVSPQRDYTPWAESLPERVAADTTGGLHGSASYLFGDSGALLLAYKATGRPAFADRLHAAALGNLHNAANEPLWGNAGTVLAAIHMAEATGGEARWVALVQQAVQALLADMMIDPDIGTGTTAWNWQQALYGKTTRYLGAGHGFAGNAYPALRAAALIDAGLLRSFEQRALDTLSATALHGTLDTPQGPVALVNWNVVADAERLAQWRARGGRPLVQDCHGAPGIVCRLAGAPRTQAWDRLLRGAGELTWHAGPVAKGPSLCHGTAGSAMACLKLWRRFGEPLWLDRARQLAMHAVQQVENARAQHGQGRHSLWTGDAGVACVLWNCIRSDDRFPSLDHC
jgi:hypothetical protein